MVTMIFLDILSISSDDNDFSYFNDKKTQEIIRLLTEKEREFECKPWPVFHFS